MSKYASTYMYMYLLSTYTGTHVTYSNYIIAFKLKGEYIICKHEKISLPSYHKISFFIGGTYYSQESSETV